MSSNKLVASVWLSLRCLGQTQSTQSTCLQTNQQTNKIVGIKQIVFDVPYYSWALDVVLQLGVRELQRDDVEQLVLVRVLVVPLPVLHRHLAVLLRVHVHHVEDAPRADAHADVVDGEVRRRHPQTQAGLLPEQQRRVEAVPLEVGDRQLGAVHLPDDAAGRERRVVQLLLQVERAPALDVLIAQRPVLGVELLLFALPLE